MSAAAAADEPRKLPKSTLQLYEAAASITCTHPTNDIAPKKKLFEEKATKPAKAASVESVQSHFQHATIERGQQQPTSGQQVDEIAYETSDKGVKKLVGKWERPEQAIALAKVTKTAQQQQLSEAKSPTLTDAPTFNSGLNTDTPTWVLN